MRRTRAQCDRLLRPQGALQPTTEPPPPAPLYEVVINGVRATTLPTGLSFGLAAAVTNRSTIEPERAEMRGGNRLLGGPSRSLPSLIVQSERHRAQSLAAVGLHLPRWMP